jgi:hypothetical protein
MSREMQWQVSLSELTVGTLCLVVVWTFLKRKINSKVFRPALPPGPPGEPLLGHLRIIPTSSPEFEYAKWGKEYSTELTIILLFI